MISRQGFGFKYVNTVEESNLRNFLERPSPKATDDRYGNYTESQIFFVTVTRLDSDYNKYIEINIVRKTSNDCDANVITTTHRLYPSMVRYNLFLQGQNGTFLASDWQSDDVVQLLYVSSHAHKA